MIDTSKPWYPQDYTLEEVLASVKRMAMSTDSEHADFLAKVERDYYVRKGGVGGIFNDLRLGIINKLGEPDEDGNVTVNLTHFSGQVKNDVADAICKLEGTSIPDTRFVVMEYAVPVMTRDEPPEYSCTPLLQEDTRPASAQGISILHQYWAMVNS